MLIGDYIDIADEIARCAKCDEAFGPISENLKTNLVVQELSLEEAGPRYVDPSRFIDQEESQMVFREFYCPSCGTMIFTETARKGEEVLNEFEIDVE